MHCKSLNEQSKSISVTLEICMNVEDLGVESGLEQQTKRTRRLSKLNQIAVSFFDYAVSLGLYVERIKQRAV